MNIIFKGKKSNAEDMSLTLNGTSDIIVYRFVCEQTSQGEDVSVVKSLILENDNCPKIKQEHPEIPSLMCSNISFSQTSNDASNNFVIDVTATYTSSDTVANINEDDFKYLISYDMQTNYKTVQFKQAYLKYMKTPPGNTQTDVEQYYAGNAKQQMATQIAWETTGEFRVPNIYPVENAVGSEIDAKTSKSYNTITIEYYCEVFTYRDYLNYINTVNTDVVTIEDLIIEPFTGKITNIIYEPIIYAVYNEAKNETEKKGIIKVNITIELDRTGWGQLLPNKDIIFKEPHYDYDYPEDVNHNLYRMKRIFTDGVGAYGIPIKYNNSVPSGKNPIPSTYGSQEYITQKIKSFGEAENGLTKEQVANFTKYVKPISKPISLDADGMIYTTVSKSDSSNNHEVQLSMYIYYLDYLPTPWSSMGFDGKKTKEYEEYLKYGV